MRLLCRGLLTVLRVSGKIPVLMLMLILKVGGAFAMDITIPDSGTTTVWVNGSITNEHSYYFFNSNGEISGGIQSITLSLPPGTMFYPNRGYLDLRLSNYTQMVSATAPQLTCELVSTGKYQATTKMSWIGNIGQYGHISSSTGDAIEGYSYNAGSMSVISYPITSQGFQGFNSKWGKGHDTVTLGISGDTKLQLIVGANAIPGAYSATYHMSCSGNTDPKNQAATTDVTFNFNLVARPTSCSITPPQTVNFGDNILTNETDTQIATAQTALQTSCDVGNGSADINRGMYLTFEPGSHGLYESNAKKLATDNQSLYITGGTDSSTSSCNTSTMTFNGAVNADYKLKVLTVGVNNAQKQLYFSLCHDTSKQLTSGNVRSDAKVNLVIQ